MMNRTLTGIVTACVGLVLAGVAQAQISIEFVRADSIASAGGVAQVLNVHTTSDWTAAAVVIELDTGSIVQDRYFAADAGATGAESGAADLNPPAVASATGPEAFGQAVLVAGACDSNLGGESLWMDSRRMDLCWYNNAPGDIGWGSIGRFTLSDDAVGTWTLAVTQAGDDGRRVFSGKVIHGRMLLDP